MAARRGIVAQFGLFSGVGVVGTAAHFLVLVLVVEGLRGGALQGSTAGFLIGAVVNYLLNYHFTFRSTKRHRSALPRFLLVATVGAGLNGLLMAFTLEALALNYLVCQVVATGLVLVWNFLANRQWTFGERLPSTPEA